MTATPHQGAFAYTLEEPYGVIGAIVTWNSPLLGIAMKSVRRRALDGAAYDPRKLAERELDLWAPLPPPRASRLRRGGRDPHSGWPNLSDDPGCSDNP